MKKEKMLLSIMVCLVSMSCFSTSNKEKNLSALLIIPSTDVQDFELNETKLTLENAGIAVTIASVEGEVVTGMLGGSFTPDLKVSDADESNYDMITLIGGNGVFGIFENKDIISLAQNFDKADKYVTAICGSAAILGNAGILDGIEATCFPYQPIIDQLVNNGATYVDKTVVSSGKIITGNGPDASTAFAEELVKVLKM